MPVDFRRVDENSHRQLLVAGACDTSSVRSEKWHRSRSQTLFREESRMWLHLMVWKVRVWPNIERGRRPFDSTLSKPGFLTAP